MTEPSKPWLTPSRIYVTLINAVYALMLLPWVPSAAWAMAILSENGTSGGFIGTLMPIGVLLFPVLFLLSIVFAWRALRNQKVLNACLAAIALPLISPLPWTLLGIAVFGR